jgi:hypothetical protein
LVGRQGFEPRREDTRRLYVATRRRALLNPRRLDKKKPGTRPGVSDWWAVKDSNRAAGTPACFIFQRAAARC